MYYEQRKPDFKITITRPRYFLPGAYIEDTIDEIGSDDGNKKMIAYEYQQTIQSLDCPFSLKFVPFIVNNKGETMIDILRPLDLVKIEEHGEVKYLGVINNIRYSAFMSESGPQRSIMASGYGVGGVLDRFSMLLDQVILSDAKTPLSAIQIQMQTLISELSAQYNANTSMYQVFDTIRRAFKTTMERIGGFTPGTGIFKVVDQYLQFSEDSKALQTKYPMALSVFSYGQITLGQAWQDLVYKPFYEFFARWDDSANKWLLVLRPTPFSPEAWLKLRKTVIDPLHVESFDCGYSADDVKSWFFAYLSGGATSYDLSRGMYQGTAIKKDPNKWALYGYRPLECTFKYVDMDKLASEGRNITLSGSQPGDPNTTPGAVSDEKLMDEYSTRIKQWFCRADEMLTGTLDMMTVKNGPRIGERVVFNDVEFYAEALTGSWTYGGKMSTQIQLTRGGTYAPSFVGELTDQNQAKWFKRASRLGDRLELKREKGQ